MSATRRGGAVSQRISNTGTSWRTAGKLRSDKTENTSVDGGGSQDLKEDTRDSTYSGTSLVMSKLSA